MTSWHFNFLETPKLHETTSWLHVSAEVSRIVEFLVLRAMRVDPTQVIQPGLPWEGKIRVRPVRPLSSLLLVFLGTHHLLNDFTAALVLWREWQSRMKAKTVFSWYIKEGFVWWILILQRHSSNLTDLAHNKAGEKRSPNPLWRKTPTRSFHGLHIGNETLKPGFACSATRTGPVSFEAPKVSQVKKRWKVSNKSRN